MIKPVNIKPNLSDSEIEAMLVEIAIEEGYATPLTPHQLDVFEMAFFSELKTAEHNIPNAQDLLDRANELRKSKIPILHAMPSMVNDEYKMAARNGDELSSSTFDKMNKAIEKAKQAK